MPSRQNKEARTYGAPMSTPAPNTSREQERQRKLESQASSSERRRLIEAHQERGQEETAMRRRDRKTEAPKPKPYTTIGEPEGRATVDILKEREGDVEATLTEIETGLKVVREEPEAQARE